MPYCDELATLMGLRIGPQMADSPRGWWKCLVAPATTMHYFWCEDNTNPFVVDASRYMPWLLVLLILMVKPADWLFRTYKWHSGKSGKGP